MHNNRLNGHYRNGKPHAAAKHLSAEGQKLLPLAKRLVSPTLFLRKGDSARVRFYRVQQCLAVFASCATVQDLQFARQFCADMMTRPAKELRRELIEDGDDLFQDIPTQEPKE